MDFLFNPELLAAFFTLTILEIVLGVDNLVFISILSGKLPEHQQKKARNIGLFLAMFVRIALLFSLSWIMQLSEPLFTMLKNEISGRDIILAVGGLFLSHSEQLPSAGDRINIYGLELTVIEVNNRRIENLTVKKVAKI